MTGPKRVTEKQVAANRARHSRLACLLRALSRLSIELAGYAAASESPVSIDDM